MPKPLHLIKSIAKEGLNFPAFLIMLPAGFENLLGATRSMIVGRLSNAPGNPVRSYLTQFHHIIVEASDS